MVPALSTRTTKGLTRRVLTWWAKKRRQERGRSQRPEEPL